MSNDPALVERFNQHRPVFLDTLGGSISRVDRDEQSCEIEFEIGKELCHSVDIVQGGFVTAMLDCTMSHAAFAADPNIANVASLEIKVSFLEPSRAGRFRCRGWTRKMGRSTGFMEGELINADGMVTATATTTAKLIRARG